MKMAHLINGHFRTFYIFLRNRIKRVVIAQQKRLMFDHCRYIVTKRCLAFRLVLEWWIGRFKRFVDFGMAELEEIATTFGVDVSLKLL